MTNIRERALNKGALPYQPPVLSRAAHARVAGSLLQALQPSQQNTQARCGQLAAFDKKKQNKKKTAAVFKRCVCRMWCVHIIVRYIYTYMYAQGCCCRSWSSFSTALTSRWRTSQRRTGAAQKLLTIKRYPNDTLTSIQNRSFIKTGSGQT